MKFGAILALLPVLLDPTFAWFLPIVPPAWGSGYAQAPAPPPLPPAEHGYAQPQTPTSPPLPPPPPEHDGYAQPEATSYGVVRPVFQFPAMPTLPPLPTFPPMQFPPLPTLPPMQLPTFPPIQNMFANWPSSYASGPTSAGAAYASPPQSPSGYGNATPQRPRAVPPPQQHPGSAGSAPSASPWTARRGSTVVQDNKSSTY